MSDKSDEKDDKDKQEEHPKQLKDKTNFPVKIHILSAGRALCGQAGVPRDWPEFDFWVPFDDPVKANCILCKRVYLVMTK